LPSLKKIRIDMGGGPRFEMVVPVIQD